MRASTDWANGDAVRRKAGAVRLTGATVALSARAITPRRPDSKLADGFRSGLNGKG